MREMRSVEMRSLGRDLCRSLSKLHDVQSEMSYMRGSQRLGNMTSLYNIVGHRTVFTNTEQHP